MYTIVNIYLLDTFERLILGDKISRKVDILQKFYENIY